ncbi:ATP-dependent helicase [Oleiphilus sp. HI0125]|uniref:SNF2-related protein n=2 Tax=Oleiphilus sp. HI0125 TaxID=1822266 RepID=UPI0007C3445F|nr:SNF2-related protein [Oleiphilus sp. HI0125]KZZ62012.1 ATP-dependent helicase [Oleiphilus sp. HI0125]
MPITNHQAKYFAHELTIQHAAGGVDRLSQSLFDASVDLNPHQINAALFALNNPLSQGVVLADEVGLGKTIEAGLVLSQYWAERRRKLLIICPASLRRQWAQELLDKFNLPSQILDAKTWKNLQKEGVYNPLADKKVVIMSYHYAARLEEQLLIEPWDLVVVDEAHKLRNAHRPSNKMGQLLKRALYGRKKLLLTATPLQNSLMELYGMSTLIDEHLFGDDKTFRQNYIHGDSSVAELKSRLKGFVHRTLRRDVLEYVKYTQRQTLTVPFTPTAQEQDLYNGISALLEREESYALPRNQRHLTGLILRKLLASSSHAVLNTLRTILKRLESLKEDAESDYDIVASIVDDDDLEQDYLEEFDGDVVDAPEVDIELLEDEIREIKLYINKAVAIETDSKAKALLTALGQGFEKMASMGAPRKVIIFTESKRTQEYLSAFLSANGFDGKIVTFSGSNNHPQATDIYKQWLTDNEGNDKISGSPQVDRRSALIDHFKHHAEVMIATEAAAEGVNLQFCSLLINYDLPWNPQRVEQRIGRCHRYGQKFDVVVINFLNKSNQADQRVLELLSEKFHLFDGVFGASDEVLGSIESGVDFEKRIQAIYETCRQPEEIESAFQQLQKELEADINEKMLETRQLLLENFDEDIHDLLKVQLDAAEQRLDKVGRWFWALTQHELKSFATFNESNHSFQLTGQIANGQHLSIQQGTYQLLKKGARRNESTLLEHAHRYRLSAPLGEWVVSQAVSREVPSAHLVFDYAAHNAKVSVIEKLQGKSGTLSLQKFSIESLERSEDYLLFAAMDNQGKVIPSEVAQKLMQLPAYEESQANHLISEQTPEEEKLNALLETERNQVEKNVNDRNLTFFEDEVNKLDAWADDLKEGLEQSIKELDKEIKQVRREAKIAPTLEEKLSLQKQQKKLESQRNRNRRDLFDKQDEVDERREALIESLEGKLNKKTTIETLFTVQWSVA